MFYSSMCAFFAWLVSFSTAPLAAGIAMSGAGKSLQFAINSKGAGINFVGQSQEARMQMASQPSMTNRTAFVECPGDQVKKLTTLVKPVLDDSDRAKVDKAAALVHIAQPGKKIKIGCVFKMSAKDRQLMLDTVQTWANKCDKIMAFSDHAWKLPGPWDVTTIPLKIKGGDSWRNTWHKMRAIMQALDHIWQTEGFDFVVVSDTDSFFVMENLQEFLSSTDFQHRVVPNGPLLIGDLWGTEKRAWVAGGGYVINRRVVEAILSCDKYYKDQVTHEDDVMISKCLKASTFQYNVFDYGPTCDSDSKDRFNYDSITQIPISDVSSKLVMFHHTHGEERFRFYQDLYGDHSDRICADMPKMPSMLARYDTEDLVDEDEMHNALEDIPSVPVRCR